MTTAHGSHRLRAGRAALTSPDVRAAQVSLAVSKVVDLAQLIGLSAYLYDSAGVGGVAAYGVVRAAAPAVGVPLVTASAERLGPGRLLMLVGTVATVAAVGITVAVGMDAPLVLVIAVAGVGHVALGTYRPVVSALLPALVGCPESLLACNAAAGLLDGVTFLAGPLLAGLLLAAAGPAAVLFMTAEVMAVAVVVGARLAVPVGGGAVRATGARSLTRASLGVAEVRVVIGLVAAQTFVRGAVNVIVVVFAVEVSGLGDSGAGLLLAAIGVGSLAGLPLAYALTGRRLYRALGRGLVLWGLPVAIASVTSDVVVVLLLFAVIGVGNDLVDLGAYSALPRLVPGRALPQVLGVFEAVLQLGTALGAAAAGILLSVADVHIALLVTGSLLPVVAVLAGRRLRSFDARLGRRDDDVDLLRSQPMFAVLPVPLLDTLVTALGTVEFAPGQVIMVEGRPGDRYVLVVRGEVAIERAGAVVAVRRAGEGFGEIALVRNTTRTATATALTAVSARTMDRRAFLAALGHDVRAGRAALEVADARMPIWGAVPHVVGPPRRDAGVPMWRKR